MNAAGDPTSADDNPCYYLHFGLIVTGKSERDHLPKLFGSLMTTGICTFRVIRRTEQRSPITSAKRQIRMVGSGQKILDKDQIEIGGPARQFLNADPCHLVVLVDDLEYDRRAHAQEVFDRYRLVLDTMLAPSQRARAAVHFLVNMLEAYYFADAAAVNAVLALHPPLEEYAGDVENIRHPKEELKRLYPGFDERRHGGDILERLDIEHVLSRLDTCAWLRSLFAWCVKALERSPVYQTVSVADKYCLRDGATSAVTSRQ